MSNRPEPAAVVSPGRLAAQTQSRPSHDSNGCRGNGCAQLYKATDIVTPRPVRATHALEAVPLSARDTRNTPGRTGFGGIHPAAERKRHKELGINFDRAPGREPPLPRKDSNTG